jgi:hypothetical protein
VDKINEMSQLAFLILEKMRDKFGIYRALTGYALIYFSLLRFQSSRVPIPKLRRFFTLKKFVHGWTKSKRSAVHKTPNFSASLILRITKMLKEKSWKSSLGRSISKIFSRNKNSVDETNFCCSQHSRPEVKRIWMCTLLFRWFHWHKMCFFFFN